MSELKPCPFCGGDDIEIFSTYPYFRDKNAYGWMAMCADCGCAVGFILHEPSMLCVEFATIDEAIAAWNARAERTCEWMLEHSGTLYDKWRCSECGYLFVEPRCDQGYTDMEPSYCPSCGARVIA